MRLWSIHPKYLDRAGLLAVWREGLLAKKVLLGRTRGYRHHPQLIRFKRQKSPLKSISVYLFHVFEEGESRGYKFNRKKIGSIGRVLRINVKMGQLEYEFMHLCSKLKKRDKKLCGLIRTTKDIICHPLFRTVRGGLEEWEMVKKGDGR